MARFDVHERLGRLVVDVQSNLLPHMGTRVVIPLYLPSDVPPPLRRLHPRIHFDETDYVRATHLMGAVPSSELGPVLGTLDTDYDRIVAAIDMLFLGF